MPTSRGSKSVIGTTRLEVAIAPLEARSATVSASLIRQSAIRESTISMAATAPAIARVRLRDRDAGAHQPLAEHEHDLGLDLGRDEPADRDRVAVAVDGGGEHGAVVGGVDADHLLHRLAGQPHLVADDAVAVGEQEVDAAPSARRSRRPCPGVGSASVNGGWAPASGGRRRALAPWRARRSGACGLLGVSRADRGGRSGRRSSTGFRWPERRRLAHGGLGTEPVRLTGSASPTPGSSPAVG